MPNDDEEKVTESSDDECPSCGSIVDGDEIECPECGEILLDIVDSLEEDIDVFEDDDEDELDDVDEPIPEPMTPPTQKQIQANAAVASAAVNDAMGLGSLGDMIEKKIFTTLRDREEKLRESMKRSVQEKERLWRKRAEKRMDDLREKHESERTALMEQLDSLRDEKENLREKLEGEKETLREKIDEYMRDIEKLKEEHSNEKEELRSKFEKEKDAIREEAASQREELAEKYKKEQDAIREEMTLQREELTEKFESEKAELTEKFEEDKKELTVRIEEIRDELKEKEKEIEERREGMIRQREELMKQFEGEKSDLTEKFEEEKKELEGRIDELRNEIKNIEREAEERRDEMRKMHEAEKESLRQKLENEKEEAVQRILEEKNNIQEALMREKEELIERYTQERNELQEYMNGEKERLKDEKRDIQDSLIREKEALKERYENELDSLKERLEEERRRTVTEGLPPEIIAKISLGIEDKLSEVIYPFPAIVGQERMKRSLLLNAINPEIQGVLLWGPVGSGKRTALVGLAEVLSDIEEVGMENIEVWDDPTRYIHGSISTKNASANYLIDTVLKNGVLNTRMANDTDDVAKPVIVVEQINQGDQHLLSYLDSLTLHVRLENPLDVDKRMEIIQRYKLFRQDPEGFHASYQEEIEILRDRIIQTRQLLPSVSVGSKQRSTISNVCIRNNLSSGTDIILEEIARTVTAYDGREEVLDEDIQEAIDLAIIHRAADSGL